MSKLQKWCPNCTQVCTLAEPGGCLSGATGYTPWVSPPLDSKLLCWHQISLWGRPSNNANVLVFLLACLLQGRGGQKL